MICEKKIQFRKGSVRFFVFFYKITSWKFKITQKIENFLLIKKIQKKILRSYWPKKPKIHINYWRAKEGCHFFLESHMRLHYGEFLKQTRPSQKNGKKMV